ncbi:hypothetical protein TL16_g12224, partial [Triparma laevis f. inornata]
MGAYLSSPSLTKETSSGTCPNPTNKSSIVTWSATSMQGWRKTMEDAHITTTSCPSTSGTNDTMVFSVFDGHGGSEVALFCEKHFVEELVKRKGEKLQAAKRRGTGRQECLLPDHPVHAGCTSVVVVVNGTTITVANAGDSRAVMMRKDDEVFPLSYDHKPSDEIESTRINGAGGFVNQFGRVNGNLNLSRSIGDLKYKQNVEVAREQQMITAEPDLITVEMLPDDEFIVVGCDGIWDCLTNEECCQFVKTRIDEMTPAKIIEECLDTIVSEDPRATQGIGGDNMSLLLIDLRSETRE